MKKESEISRMFQYAGNRHWLTIAGMILAGLSTVLCASGSISHGDKYEKGSDASYRDTAARLF